MSVPSILSVGGARRCYSSLADGLDRPKLESMALPCKPERHCVIGDEEGLKRALALVADWFAWARVALLEVSEGYGSYGLFTSLLGLLKADQVVLRSLF